MHVILFHAQLPSKCAIIHQNRLSTFGDTKICKPSSCAIQIIGKTRFSPMDVILALATRGLTQPSHSLVFKVSSNK